MMDDPKSINLLVSCYHAATTLLIVAGIPVFGGLLVTLALLYLINRPANSIKRLVELGVAVLVFCFVAWVLRQDPFRVGAWFMD